MSETRKCEIAVSKEMDDAALDFAYGIIMMIDESNQLRDLVQKYGKEE